MPQESRSCPLPQKRLPIADRQTLRAALVETDVPTMLMVLTQYQRDEVFLERFSPYIGSPFRRPSEPLPEELAQELRDRLFSVLTQEPAAEDLPLPAGLTQKMMSINTGEPVSDEFIPPLMEQMGFEKQRPRRENPERPLPSRNFKVVVIGAGLSGLLAGIKLQECLDCMINHKGSAIEPTQEAFEAFNAKVEEDLKGLVWSHPKARS